MDDSQPSHPRPGDEAMHPSLAHPIDRSILAPSIAPHTLESREGDDSCKTRVSLGHLNPKTHSV